MNKPLSPADVLSFTVVEDAQIAPDGERVAYVLADSFKLESPLPRASIWLVDSNGSQQLTTGPRSDSHPRWSPCGKRLAFLSDRQQPGRRQIYLLNLNGGEAKELTQVDSDIPSPRGLNCLQWSPDGRYLAFLLVDSFPEEENDAIVFEEQPLRTRIWRLEVETGDLVCVSPDDLQIWEFDWHPDSRQFAAVVSAEPYEWSWYRNRLVFFEPGGVERLIWSESRQVALPRWSPQGEEIAFVTSNWSDRGCAAGDIVVANANTGKGRHVTAGVIASFGWTTWSADGNQLLSIAHERGGTSVNRIQLNDDSITKLWWDEAAVSEAFSPRFSVTTEWNRIAVVREDACNPREVFIGELAEDSIDWRKLTSSHPNHGECQLGETEVVHWQGADDWEMQGLLIKPIDYQPNQRYPLVMWVHGGPSGVCGSRFYACFGYCQLMASQGYAVFMPNYRGSIGWGLEFAESNIGDMGGKDFQDMMLGIDALIDGGIADPDRLAIAGWSYGGFTAAWAVAQSDRFSASIMGAGISHWLSFHGKSCLSDWDAIHYQANPYDTDGPFARFSPVNYYDQLNTPTLILHGEQDEDVPVEQSYLFHRALKNRNVATQLVVYPREAHAISERDHMLDVSQRMIDWLARWLKT